MKSGYIMVLSIFCNFIYAQDGKKDDTIKYLIFDNKKDEKKEYPKKIFFYIDGETFIYLKSENKLRVCDVRFLRNIKITTPMRLNEQEYVVLKREYINQNRPVPITKYHSCFSVVVIEKKSDRIIKYSVYWTYDKIRGFYP